MASENIRIKYVVDSKELAKSNELLKNSQKENNLTQKEVDQTTSKFKKQGKELSGLNGTIKKVGATLIAAFAADRIIDFAKGVIDVTGNFQKMGAVLTNTLGSSSRAQKALKDIQEFAAVTPFAVSGLTDSFVKLANQGFAPTIDQMRKLGDLASSTGKDFDMLVEAIIDAQVGEFERLKEFGIRASKQGDQVSFAFKGVKTQVDFTSEAIREYVLGLGDLEGVSGGMAAISDTVAGKVSNLGDNFEALQKTIGDSSSGLIAGVLDLSNAFLSAAASGEIFGSDTFWEDINARLSGLDFETSRKEAKDFLEGIATEEPKKQLELFNEELAKLRGQFDEITVKQKNGDIGRIEGANKKLEIEEKIETLMESQLDLQAAGDAATANEIKNEQKKLEAQKIAEAERLASHQKYLERVQEAKNKAAMKDAEKLAEEFDEQIQKDLEREESNQEILDRKLEKISIEDAAKQQSREENLSQEEIISNLSVANADKEASEKKAIQAAENEFILSSSLDLLAALGAVAGRGTQMQKVAALASIAIDTGKAIASLTAASEGNPANAVTYGGAGIGQFIAGIARIGINIANAKATLDKFEDGGRIGGNLHSSGGTIIEAERNEFVMSRKATSKYGFDLMNKINGMELDPDILSGASGGGSINIINTESIAAQLKKMPQNILNIDGEGFTSYQRREQSTYISKAKRYSTI